MSSVKGLLIMASVMYTIQFLIVMLSPERLKSIVRPAISIIVISIIVTQAMGIDYSQLYASFNVIDYTEEINSQDEYVIHELETQLEEYITAEIAALGISLEKVRVYTTIDGDRCISISEIEIYLYELNANTEAGLREYISNKVGDVPLSILLTEE